MRVIRQDDLDRYLKDDWVLEYLECSGNKRYVDFVSDKWLLESPAKRYIFSLLYGRLMNHGEPPLTILDVGGGLSSFTNILSGKHSYCLVDIMAHDNSDAIEFAKENSGASISMVDWQEHIAGEQYDVVIANDIFPNVDQRLAEFLDKYLPISKTILCSLTYYDACRYYKVKRVDADEIFFIIPWGSKQLIDCLGEFRDKIVNPDFSELAKPNESVFPNKRSVCIVEFRGDISRRE